MKISHPVFKSLVALALGAFGACMSEFTMMGVLPDIAQGLDAGIPQAGHFISAYAIGVCVGGPLTVVAARSRPLKNLLLWLMALFILGNALTALAQNYPMMLAARFVAGLPHGAYFGVAAIVADKLVDRAYSVMAISIVVSGATLANLAGVPCATFIARLHSWRMSYAVVACVGVAAVLSILIWVPRLPGLKNSSLRDQFRFLKSPAPWLVGIAIMLGNGGLFCWYSYISPIMTDVAGFDASRMTLIMAAAGCGMLVGNMISGRLSLRFRAETIAAGTQCLMCVVLALIFLFARLPFAAVALMFVGTACMFALSAPEQMLLLRNAEGGEMLGSALAQIGFNAGNALGAFCGGLAISGGYGYAATALPGVALAFGGFLLLLVYAARYGKKGRDHTA